MQDLGVLFIETGYHLEFIIYSIYFLSEYKESSECSFQDVGWCFAT